MGSLSEEDYTFFDASDDVASVSDDPKYDNSTDYDMWVKTPASVEERRSNFMSWMELMTEEKALEDSVRRLAINSSAVLRNGHSEDRSLSYFPGISGTSYDASFYRNGCAFESEEVNPDECCREGYDFASETASDHARSSRARSVDELGESTNSPRRFKNWLNRLRSIACVVDNQQFSRKESDSLRKVQRVRVNHSGKRFKELSAVYVRQDIQAHSGAILAMKFSPDGEFLASAGMDGVLRVWKVLEDDRSSEISVTEMDSSCIYFTVNHLSELKPIVSEKEKSAKTSRNLKKTSESACVVFPPKVFRIVEEPVHEFHGHTAEILDLSWSSTNHILTASADNTVRLWRVGCDRCLRVFSHSNYVTCVQFNPADDSRFISGSIDGKVRIWNMSSFQVEDWTDVKDIVTAVCYRPDGQGGVIGSMEGNCRFFSMSENHLQLDAQTCPTNKKRAACRRITSFQFFPEDSSKLMVTSADSNVRILQGQDVITKYKSSKSAGNLLSASLTSNRKHIISASEDSNVYIWKHVEDLGFSPQVKTVKSSERFSADATIAIPWCGFSPANSETFCESPASFSISQEYFLESLPRGSATWPEEKLTAAVPTAGPAFINSSRLKFLKASCQNSVASHAWGLVIVTAGYDGRIKSFHNYGLPVSQ